MNIDNFPTLSEFPILLPKGIVPSNAEVRLERTQRCASPVCLTPRYKQREAKPAPLLIKEERVEEVTFPASVPSPFEEEDFGHLVHIGISEEIVEYSSQVTGPEIVEIEEELRPESPAADICEILYSGTPLENIEASLPDSLEPDSTVGHQVQPGDLAVGIPEPVSPIAPDSEAERQEMLKLLSDCKPN